MRQRIWALASQSDILVLITGLLHVPWEALFNPAARPGSFLSDLCVVVRWPEETGETSRGGGTVPDFSKERVICVDRLLAKELVSDAGCVEEILRYDGEEVYVTSRKGDLVRQVKDVRMVHWICEHHKNGLRLDSDVYYAAEDSPAHRFAEGSILVLTSCSSGARSATETSIAASICTASNCTVIAPSSVVAARAGVSFARKMNTIIRASAGPLQVADLWSAVKGFPFEKPQQERPTTVEACYALWYGIYANCEALVKTS
jgi:hypothetical protein